MAARREFHPTAWKTSLNCSWISSPASRYCRVNRVIRDIPGNNVVEGNTRTSLRQDIQAIMKKRGTICQCIRCREVRGKSVDSSTLRLDDHIYSGSPRNISSRSSPRRRAGRIHPPLSPEGRLASPQASRAGRWRGIIREVHVYGQSSQSARNKQVLPSMLGWARLLEEAEKVAVENGYKTGGHRRRWHTPLLFRSRLPRRILSVEDLMDHRPQTVDHRLSSTVCGLSLK